MTNPNRAFKQLKNSTDREVEICCMECGEIRFVKNSVWWDDSMEIECGECGNVWEWEIAQ